MLNTIHMNDLIHLALKWYTGTADTACHYVASAPDQLIEKVRKLVAIISGRMILHNGEKKQQARWYRWNVIIGFMNLWKCLPITIYVCELSQQCFPPEPA